MTRPEELLKKLLMEYLNLRDEVQTRKAIAEKTGAEYKAAESRMRSAGEKLQTEALQGLQQGGQGTALRILTFQGRSYVVKLNGPIEVTECKVETL